MELKQIPGNAGQIWNTMLLCLLCPYYAKLFVLPLAKLATYWLWECSSISTSEQFGTPLALLWCMQSCVFLFENFAFHHE